MLPDFGPATYLNAELCEPMPWQTVAKPNDNGPPIRSAQLYLVISKSWICERTFDCLAIAFSYPC